MRAPLSWLREFAAVGDASGRRVGEDLVRVGLEVETVEAAGADVTGPLVVGRVLALVPEPQKNGKTINWCQVDVGEHNDPEFADPAFATAAPARGIVCGAHNFAAGDLVVVALPGSVLPGDFAIAARKTYGHVSDGMICSAQELGLGDDHSGIIVLGSGEVDGLAPGQDAGPVLHLRDDVLDIAVTPDRGYCWSVRGLAREAAQAAGVAFTDPVDRAVPGARSDGYPVVLESDACPLFVALRLTGLDPSRPSPRWLTRRLQLAGMRPISLAVDVTNYVMLETGQPLHAYDADLLQGPIVVRQAGAGETLATLDDVTRPLDSDDLVIADDAGPIGLAGVMGGASTELRDSTSSVIIEAAHFDALTIARTSRRHKLSSEASRRFERGVDPAATYAAAHRAAGLLVELGGAALSAEETIAGTVPDVTGQTITADLPARVMGAPIAAETTVELLRAVGVEVTEQGEQLALRPPTWRPDLRDPYDYVEEVGRLYGYERVEPVVPAAPVGRGLTRSQRSRRLVNAALTSVGFTEVLSFPFLGESELDRLQVPSGDRRRRLTRLANPLSETQPAMRTTLLPGLFAAVALNTSRSNDDLALYEAGSVFFAADEALAAPRPGVDSRPSDADLAAMDAATGDQPRHLAAVLTGDWLPTGWTGPAQKAGWPQALFFARTAARALGAELIMTAADQRPWHPGRCAAVAVATPSGEAVPIGFAGELHPDVCRAFGVPARTCAVELDLDALIAAAPVRGSVSPISPFPVIKEDVALVVASDVPAGDVEAALREGAGELLESLHLFDVFTGAQVGEGHKSLAYNLRFRAPDRTLTDAEAAAARDAAVAKAAERTGAVLRS